ncbi:hypothetical protein [Nonomuraea salmonea]|uniref:hypothetical protein n=1 Tax=Nonomuraea salmonea TaxID=46181 RepID=UPI002FE8F35A
MLGALSLLAMTAVQVVSGLDARPDRYVTVIVALLAASAVAFAAESWGGAGRCAPSGRRC